MPVANLKPHNIVDTMNPDQKVGKSDEGNDSLDTFIRQAVGKESLFSFSRAGDSPVQWIQLLQALDYQDVQGWPLLPPKVTLQKCDKCAREFCSTINYRRHIRVHRRALNIVKDFPKNREVLGAFWDKLPLDKAMEVVSFENITLEEVPGSSIIKALTSVVRRPGFSSLPQVYVDAGSALLDVVQATPSRFPISSEELFSILDDASEKTFLCAGTALSMQKFVFDGEAGKIGLELKNVVACTCFLVEQSLIKAWLADKDAEALRCQQLLMEEEEAAHRRQAELLERRRLKKLRQKEQQKAKEQPDKLEADFGESSSDSMSGPPSVEIYSPPTAADAHTLEQLDLEPLHLNANEEQDISCFSELDDVQFDSVSIDADSKKTQTADHQTKKGSAHWRQIVTRRRSPNSHPGASNGFHGGVVHGKSGPVHRQGNQRDPRSTSQTNGHKVWTRKTKPDNAGFGVDVGILGVSRDITGLAQDSRDQLDQNENCEVSLGEPRDMNVTQDSRGQLDQNESCVVLPEEARDLNAVAPQDSRGQLDQSENCVVLPEKSRDLKELDQNENCVVLLGESRDSNAPSSQDSTSQLDQNENCEVLLGESRELNAVPLQDVRGETDQIEKFEFFIGSIPITLRECEGRSFSAIITPTVDQYGADNPLPHSKNVHEKNAESETLQCATNRSVDKQETATTAVNDEKVETDFLVVMNKVAEEASRYPVSLPSHSTDDSMEISDSSKSVEGVDSGPNLFSRGVAQAFLTERWNEAVAGDHVRLVLSPESEPPKKLDNSDDTVTAEPLNPNILCSSENRMGSVGPPEPAAANGAPEVKSKPISRVCGRVRYIPKKKVVPRY